MGRRRNRSHKPRQHASSSQPHDRRHRDQDETSNAGEDSLLIDQNNDDNSGVAANGTKNPNQHGVNEALIARWTRRLGIYTLVLAVATVALVIATGIGAYFLYETDRSIKDQLQEMRAQTATTKAQVRANISPDPFGVDQVIENGQITAWQITPRWR